MPSLFIVALTLCLSLFTFAPQSLLANSLILPGIKPNGQFEFDEDGDNWPDGWAKVEPGGSYLKESGNHFIRLTSPKPDQMVMLYQEIPIPEGVEAIELQWKQRITGLKVGKNSWFDARILMEFMDQDRKKVTPTPSAPASRKDTDGWVHKKVEFLVPDGAKTLKFMPCLFQVASGTFDLDDIILLPVDPKPIRKKRDQAAAERLAKLEAAAEKRRDKAHTRYNTTGSLLLNGNFETDAKQDGRPDDWGKLKTGGSWESENGNHFIRMTSPKPGEMVMMYHVVDIPKDAKALELSWRQRVSNLKKGTSPWFDARIMLEYQGIDGKKLSKGNPSPPYTQKNTDGWVTKSISFLVPDDALSLVMMPCLFQVQSGTFDIEDLVLKPIDPAPLYAAAKKRETEIEARYVAPEEPIKSQWPSELKVVGNRLHNEKGNEVWLQGVNAGGLETLPFDRQVIKSVVVAIDEWNANCVRVPMNEAFWYGKSSYQKDYGKEYREILDQIITLAANRGAYIVIDLHRFRAPKIEHTEFWKDFATKYRDHPAVLFDIFNEPHGVSWDQWRNGGWIGTEKGTDESAFLTEAEKLKNRGFESVGMQGLVDAVRSTGANNVIIAGGVFWCNDLSGIADGYALDDPSGHGIMYSWHTYNWHTGWEQKVLATAAQYPIFVGECGADIKKMDFIPLKDQEDPATWVPDMLGFIQKHRLNWTGWNLHPKSSPVMISDWSYTPTPFWGAPAKRALAGENFPLKKTR